MMKKLQEQQGIGPPVKAGRGKSIYMGNIVSQREEPTLVWENPWV